jgi:hypothetical protein
MDKRYQVFVSSTFQDLQDERKEVIQALLELDCIPSGMELFQAANENQWEVIKKVIDDCDYYVLILAGRYGSIGSQGISYTEMEYRYALETGKPIIGFLHKDPNKIPLERSEGDEESKKKLYEFRRLVQEKMIRFWNTAEELGGVVSRSLVNLIKTNPATGWIRADQISSTESLAEIYKLQRLVNELREENKNLKNFTGTYSTNLANGEEKFKISYFIELRDTEREYVSMKKIGEDREIFLSWNEIFSSIAPNMVDEAPEYKIQRACRDHIGDLIKPQINDWMQKEGLNYFTVTIFDKGFAQILVQLSALKLITRSVRNRGVKDRHTYWTLTPQGVQKMYELLAIPSKGGH